MAHGKRGVLKYPRKLVLYNLRGSKVRTLIDHESLLPVTEG
jgi:hypothetical protein